MMAVVDSVILNKYAKIPQQSVDSCCVDPEDTHFERSTVVTLCHAQITSSGTELSVWILIGPGTHCQLNFDSYVSPFQCMFVFCRFSFGTELQSDYVMHPRLL